SPNGPVTMPAAVRAAADCMSWRRERDAGTPAMIVGPKCRDGKQHVNVHQGTTNDRGAFTEPMASEPAARRVLVISGSTRHHSTNTALCLTAAAHAPDGIAVECFTDIAALPHFDPDDDRDPLPAPVAAVRSAVTDADAVLFCTPEYAGTLPGTF